ncbi:hypothetical protein L1049_012098 [Liquidambar formosana]|uniref:Glutaredoxin domain-containing protein n=1 Tax=Liquidambar formosana TaxID=63359 RepID=A0AAP0RTN8_LIQFO
MKGMKGKILKKLKSIRPIGYLKQDRFLQVSASDGFVENFVDNSNLQVQTTQNFCKEAEQKKIIQSSVTEQEPDIIDATELMRDLEDDEMEFDDDIDNKENIGPSMKATDPVPLKGKSEASMLSEQKFRRNGTPEGPGLDDVSSFRRPDLNSGSLFDPNLLAAFEQAVKEQIRISELERKARIEEENREKSEEPPTKVQRVEEKSDPLLDFEEKCPPGGSESVILYTTSLRGIRKTFEDCNSIRFLLESFRVLFFERDVSMHSEFREELWRILDGKAVPPRLFIKGRYIGRAEEVLVLHEQGRFRPLFEGIPIDRSNGPCDGCAGVRFVMCFKCSGSHKIIADDGSSTQCAECNENGLIICPICC